MQKMEKNKGAESRVSKTGDRQLSLGKVDNACIEEG